MCLGNLQAPTSPASQSHVGSGESEADSRLDFGTGCIEAELERSPSAVDVDFGGLTMDAALSDLVDSAVEETTKFEWDLISVKSHFDWPPPVGVARDASCWWRDSHLFHKEVKAADVWESLLESVGFDVGGGTDREIKSHEKSNPPRVGGCKCCVAGGLITLNVDFHLRFDVPALD